MNSPCKERVLKVKSYVSLCETKEEIEVVALSHGWDLDEIHLYELSTIEEQIRGNSESTFFHPSEGELNRTIGALIAEVERVKPVRVVFDSLSEMRMLADTALCYRRQILQLKQTLCGRCAGVSVNAVDHHYPHLGDF